MLLAEYIYSELLDSAHAHSFVLQIETEESPATQIALPARTTLLLQHLSDQLGVNIFMFSSKGPPKVFHQDPSRSSIVFFHDVSSFTNRSRFVVLAYESTATTTSTASTTPTTTTLASATLIPVAQYRKSARPKRTSGTHGVKEDDLKKAFRSAW